MPGIGGSAIAFPLLHVRGGPVFPEYGLERRNELLISLFRKLNGTTGMTRLIAVRPDIFRGEAGFREQPDGQVGQRVRRGRAGFRPTPGGE